MKTYTAFLTLAAAVLGTNSLSATAISQEEPNEEKTIIRSHSCSSCTPEFLLSIDEEKAGKGIFELLPKDATQNILSELPVIGVLTVSLISKAMNNLCRSPLIWERLAVKENITFSSFGGCINEQFKEIFAPFSNPNKSYKVTIAQIKSFKTTVLDPRIETYKFELKNRRQYELQNYTRGPDGLEYLSDDAYVTFMPVQPNPIPTFQAEVAFCSHIQGIENPGVKLIKNLDDNKHKAQSNRAARLQGTQYYGNFFVIKRITRK